MSTTALDILIAARASISEPENWGRGFISTRPRHTLCALQAIGNFGTNPAGSKACNALRSAAALGINTTISDWNDAPERTHAEVLAAFDRAIDNLRAA